MKTFALFALLASATATFAAAPSRVTGVISQDATGYVVKGELIQHYTRLCKLYPQMGDKPGDGVFIEDEGVFHLDTAHFNDYLKMTAREQRVAVDEIRPSAEVKIAN